MHVSICQATQFASVCGYLYLFGAVSGVLSLLVAICRCQWSIVPVSGALSLLVEQCRCQWVFVPVSGCLSLSVTVCPCQWRFVSVNGDLSLLVSVWIRKVALSTPVYHFQKNGLAFPPLKWYTGY